MPVSKISVFDDRFVEFRRLAVDRAPLGDFDGPAPVDRLADQVEHPAQTPPRPPAPDRAAGVGDLGATLQTVGGAQGDRANPAATQMLSDLAPQGLVSVFAQDGARRRRP